MTVYFKVVLDSSNESGAYSRSNEGNISHHFDSFMSEISTKKLECGHFYDNLFPFFNGIWILDHH